MNLPTAFFLTDPRRTPDPMASIHGLPPNVGVVVRAYDVMSREDALFVLKEAVQTGRMVLIATADEELLVKSRAAGACGRHLAHWQVGHASPEEWDITTAAAHELNEIITARSAGIRAVFLSPVFTSDSHPDTTPLGPERFISLAEQADMPVYALGGMTAKRFEAFQDKRNVAGYAAIGAFL